MEMTFVIRTLDEGDSIADLTVLLHASYAQLGAVGFNYTAVDQSEDVTRNRIKNGECHVAIDGGRLIGTILFCRHYHGSPWYEQRHVAAFAQFGVLPDCQRAGLGRRLVDVAEDRARATGATDIALDTSEGAHHLVQWYERLGYRTVEIAQWRGKTYRSVIMSKSLGPA